MLPAKLKAFNVFVDGVGFAGEAEEVVPPKLGRKLEEHRAGGMDSPIKIDLGGNALETEITMSGLVADILKKYGSCDVSGVSIASFSYRHGVNQSK